MDNLLLEPWVWLIVIILTLLGTAFSLVKYTVGKDGMDEILDRYPQLGRERLERIAGMYDRHGSVILLGSAIPGVDTLGSVRIDPREPLVQRLPTCYPGLLLEPGPHLRVRPGQDR